jgi:glycerol-3-phosphate acyltransferase PlsY
VLDVLKIVASLAIGYLLGSLNTAVLVGRLYGKEVSRLGSGNPGLTNALRVLGKRAAALVLAGDVAKALAACLIGLAFGVYVVSGDARDCVSMLAAGGGAVIGHNWPLYFRFKGGKGVLTAISVMFMASWREALLSLGLFVVVVALTRFVSLGTLCATAFFVALSFVPAFNNTAHFQVFTAAMALVIVIRHRANIGRLLAGTENRFAY